MTLRMILVIFMDFTYPSFNKKMSLNFKRLYIKLSTTERAPYTYRLQETEDISLLGIQGLFLQSIYQTLSMYRILEDLLVEGHIKELRRYNDVSPYELFVVSCPLDEGLEIFVGVPSERYPAHLESRFHQADIMQTFTKLITLRMKRGIILNRLLHVTV